MGKSIRAADDSLGGPTSGVGTADVPLVGGEPWAAARIAKRMPAVRGRASDFRLLSRIVAVDMRGAGATERKSESGTTGWSFWRRYFGLPEKSVVLVDREPHTIEFAVRCVSAVGSGLVRVNCRFEASVSDATRFVKAIMKGRDALDELDLSTLASSYARPAVEERASQFLTSDLIEDSNARATLESDIGPAIAARLADVGIALKSFVVESVEGDELLSGDSGEATGAMGGKEGSSAQEVGSTLAMLGEAAEDVDSRTVMSGRALLAIRVIALFASLSGLGFASFGHSSLPDAVRLGLYVQTVAAAAVVIVEAIRIHRTGAPEYLGRRQKVREEAVYEVMRRKADRLIREKVSGDVSRLATTLREAAGHLTTEGCTEVALELRDLAQTVGTAGQRSALSFSRKGVRVGRRPKRRVLRAVNQLDSSIISSNERLKGIGREILRNAEAGAAEEIALPVETLRETLRDLEQAVRDRETVLQA